MLPIVIPDQAVLEKIADEARAGKEIEIDLPAQEIRNESGKRLASFEVDSFRKHCLINGLDDIGLTMQIADSISKYEKRMMAETPWIFNLDKFKGGNQGSAVAVDAAPVPKIMGENEKTKPLDW